MEGGEQGRRAEAEGRAGGAFLSRGQKALNGHPDLRYRDVCNADVVLRFRRPGRGVSDPRTARKQSRMNRKSYREGVQRSRSPRLEQIWPPSVWGGRFLTRRRSGEQEGGRRETCININFWRSARMSWIGAEPPSLARRARQGRRRKRRQGGSSADPREIRRPCGRL